MSQLSVAGKEAILLKALNRGSQTVASIAKANNVGLSTLYEWLQKHREGKPLGIHSGQSGAALTQAEKLGHIMDTHHLNEVSLGEYCRAHGLYSHQLTEWRETFMKTPQTTPHLEQQAELKKLKDENKQLQRELRHKEKALAEASALLVMKKKSRLDLGGKRGRLISPEDRAQAIALVNEAHASGARKHKACELLNLSLRTVERWEKPAGTQDKRCQAVRPSQANQLTQEERNMILTIANSQEYCDLPPCKIVPRLADEGLYFASESTFYRVLRAEKQLTHRQRSKPATHHKPKARTADGPNQVWSWDISYLPTTVVGLYFYLYLVLDIFSRKIVGWSIHANESSALGAGLIKQACLDEGVEYNQLVLHSDNGKPMKGATMLATLEKLGVIPSFSRPSVSDDNPYSESLFKTVKYHPTFPIATRFNTIDDARIWMEQFTAWYNTQHLHSGLKFITPEQRHTGLDNAIFKKRAQVYEMAKLQRPERWSGDTRNWSLPVIVTLNPDRKNTMKNNEMPSVILAAA